VARRSAQGDGARADVTASLFNPEEFVPALFSSALEISGWTSIVIGGAVCLFWSEAAHQGGTVAYVAILFVGGLINMSRGLSLEISVEAAEEGGDLPPASVIDAHRGFRLRMFALVLLNLSVWFCTGALPSGWIGGGIMMGSFAVILSGCLAMRWKTRLPHATPAVAVQAAAAVVTPAVATSSVAAPAVAAATPPGAETYRVVVSGGVGLRTVHALDAPRTGETLAQGYVFVAAESRDFRHQGRLQWIRVPATSSCRGGWVVVAQRDPVFKEKELQILELVPTRKIQGSVQKIQLQVTVPAGAVPGTTIQLKIPDGRQIQVQVPAGKKQGDAFLVNVPALAQVAAPQPALEPAVAAPLPAPAATTSDPAPAAASLVVPAEIPRYECSPPKGKLGVVFSDAQGGPCVSEIRPSSVLCGQVQLGDRLISIDEMDTTGMSGNDAVALLVARAELARRLVFESIEVAAPGAELPSIAAASPIARDATAGDIAGANPANIKVTGEQQFALLSILAGAIGLVVGVVTLVATVDLAGAAGWLFALLLTIGMGSVVGA
jgi:hypothetical protein